VRHNKIGLRCPLWVNSCRDGSRRSCPLYPRKRTRPIGGEVGSPFVGGATCSARLASHVDLLGYGHGIINLDTKIANRALDLRMAKQQLNSPQIAGTAID
jgi:hypothetical protein